MFKLLLKGLRQGAGRTIMFAYSLCPPSVIQRTPTHQKEINEQTQHLTLYQFAACPFCIKVRRAMRRLNLDITLKDALLPAVREELLAGGGNIKVPCLRIEDGDTSRWLYESDDIIQYLEERFG